jgi:hypothetical protein
MRVESLTSRLEFNERRARALESVVVYSTPAEEDEAAGSAADRSVPDLGSPQAGAGGTPTSETAAGEGPGQRSRRRRRRRGRRGGASSSSGLDAAGVPRTSTKPVSDAGEAGPESAEELDHRVVRPEPLEQVMAVSSHPAEHASREPDPSGGAKDDENSPASAPPGGPADES